MGKGDVATRSKSQKSSAIQNEQSTPTNPPTAYPDWSQFQAYYNAAGSAPVTPPAFFHSSVAPSPQGHPYMWGPQMMPPYGTPPPYAAMYAQGTPYQQASMPPGSHPYSPYPMQSPNGTVQTPTSGAGGTETDKSSKNKRKDPLKRSRGSLGSLYVVAPKIIYHPQNLQLLPPMKVLHKVRVEVGVLLKEAVQIQKVYAIALYNFFTFDLKMLYKFQNNVSSILLIIEGLVCIN